MPNRPWAVVLAGGEGKRLRSLTTRIAGDDRPKQFCALLGEKTLLEQTVRRADLIVPREQTMIVLSRHHMRYYAPLVERVDAGAAVIEPYPRGTAPAVLYALLRIATVAPDAVVTLMPSDHWVSDESRFMAYVEDATSAVYSDADRVVLLGIVPEAPETEYGWIEPGQAGENGFHEVRRFWEKPPQAEARRLLAQGALWNSFVIVGAVATLLDLIRTALPDLDMRLRWAVPTFGTSDEGRAVERVYLHLPAYGFSEAVLTPNPHRLFVQRVDGVGWSDLGHPTRVLATVARTGEAPAWSLSEVAS